MLKPQVSLPGRCRSHPALRVGTRPILRSRSNRGSRSSQFPFSTGAVRRPGWCSGRRRDGRARGSDSRRETIHALDGRKVRVVDVVAAQDEDSPFVGYLGWRLRRSRRRRRGGGPKWSSVFGIGVRQLPHALELPGYIAPRPSRLNGLACHVHEVTLAQRCIEMMATRQIGIILLDRVDGFARLVPDSVRVRCGGADRSEQQIDADARLDCSRNLVVGTSNHRREIDADRFLEFTDFEPPEHHRSDNGSSGTRGLRQGSSQRSRGTSSFPALEAHVS
jgi:hypothetical protein